MNKSETEFELAILLIASDINEETDKTSILLLLFIFLLLSIWWNVGSGYNEYNRAKKEVKIYRKGFPGKNRELLFIFPFSKIKSIKMRIKEGINPKRQLLLCLTDSREIPLTGIEQPIAINKIEDEAITIAKYLNVFLETE